MSIKVDVNSLDLYNILEVPVSADESEIKKAYRKKALKCHPDKNPDNPAAIEQFHILSKALEILLDGAARKAYDKVLRAKNEAKARVKQLDAKRQKLKEELEAREKKAEADKKVVRLTAEQEAEKLKKEIERLRKEGSKQLEEEQEFLRQEILKEKQKLSGGIGDAFNHSCRIKAKWKPSLDDYSKERIQQIFSKYGAVTDVVVISGKKRSSALVEFNDSKAAKMAVELERGLINSPLSVELLQSESSEVKSGAGSQTDFPEAKQTELDDYEERLFRMMSQAQAKKNVGADNV